MTLDSIRPGIKRGIDLLIGATALLASAPLLATTALAIRCTMGKKVFFRQTRAGRYGKPIQILKFRTMTDARGQDGSLLPDAERLTPVGRFVRATSLDELPQLINVLRGDLSLVGPRPLLMQYLDRYSPEQRRRHLVKPGITGWAQVNGRNSLSWNEKFELDVWYVDNWSLLLDLKILGMTAVEVLKRSGVSKPGHATMPEFMGNGERK